MGALHQVASTYYGTAEGTGHPSDTMGFAVGAGIKLNAPMIGKGDYLQAEFDYTQGASRYSNMTALAWNYVKYDGQQVAIGLQSDAVYGGSVAGGTASDLELTTTWGANAAYTHFWNPAWKSTLWGSYHQTSYNDAASAMIANGGGTGTVAPAGFDAGWNAWGLGLRTEWAVSKTFQMGLEVMYANLSGMSTPGNTIALAANNGKPAGTYTLSDQDDWAVRFRVNRPFYP
jgi:hypothetical protein